MAAPALPELELDPAHSALIVFDAVEQFRPAIEERGVLGPIVELTALCRTAGIATIFTRGDHRADGRGAARSLPDLDRAREPYVAHGHGDYVHASKGAQFLAELEVGDADITIEKHRWSAFSGTPLDSYLRTMRIDTILIVGGSLHIGVASTIYSARDLDYQVVAVRDGCHAAEPERSTLLDVVLPQICRVRSLDEVRRAL